MRGLRLTSRLIVFDIWSPKSANVCSAFSIFPAIQQRYMPGVYRAVHRRILAALEAYSGAPLTYRGRRIVRTWESEAAAAPSVDRLTAAFVRLVYPLWGASTTATIVRKARSRP